MDNISTMNNNILLLTTVLQLSEKLRIVTEYYNFILYVRCCTDQQMLHFKRISSTLH